MFNKVTAEVLRIRRDCQDYARITHRLYAKSGAEIIVELRLCLTGVSVSNVAACILSLKLSLSCILWLNNLLSLYPRIALQQITVITLDLFRNLSLKNVDLNFYALIHDNYQNGTAR